MVVQIKGPVGSKEYEYGCLLKELFEKDPQLRTEENRIDIIVSAQCYGQKIQDIDLVVFGKFNNYYINVNWEDNAQKEKPQLKRVKILDFCTVIEVKAHDIGNIRFEGPEIIVKYNGNDSWPLHQSRNQMFSLMNYLHLKGKLNVTNFVFLPNVLIKHLPDFIKGSPVKYHIILSDFTLEQFWQSLLKQSISKLVFNGEYDVYKSSLTNTSDNYIETLVFKLTEKISPSRLDREKMERICRAYIKNQNYVEKLGQQLLIYRGKGGTGKTYCLLNVAHNLYEDYGLRILILTYNNALVADIKRLFALLQISDGVEESIQIRTWHSYLGKLYYVTGIAGTDVGTSNIDSEEYKEKLLEYLSQEFAKQKLEVALKTIEKSELLYWDYIMVDEAQDWKPLERDILYKLFGFKKIIIAHGINQLIRSPVSCDWRYHPTIKSCSQVVPLKMSLRQKPNLSRFITVFSKETGLDWDVKVNDESYGGKVIIFIGKYDLNIHTELIDQNRADKNENIDMLFCVPSKDINKESCSFARMLEKQGYLVWDGTSQKIRSSSYPMKLDEFRIVQYDSCRGLEGWISVNIAFDSFYEEKLKNYREEKGQQNFLSSAEKRKIFAGNWLQIPITRAIDTLVINIENHRSPLYTILKKIYEANQEYIEWREPVV